MSFRSNLIRRGREDYLQASNDDKRRQVTDRVRAEGEPILGRSINRVLEEVTHRKILVHGRVLCEAVWEIRQEHPEAVDWDPADVIEALKRRSVLDRAGTGIITERQTVKKAQRIVREGWTFSVKHRGATRTWEEYVIDRRARPIVSLDMERNWRYEVRRRKVTSKKATGASPKTKRRRTQ